MHHRCAKHRKDPGQLNQGLISINQGKKARKRSLHVADVSLTLSKSGSMHIENKRRSTSRSSSSSSSSTPTYTYSENTYSTYSRSSTDSSSDSSSDKSRSKRSSSDKSKKPCHERRVAGGVEDEVAIVDLDARKGSSKHQKSLDRSIDVSLHDSDFLSDNDVDTEIMETLDRARKVPPKKKRTQESRRQQSSTSLTYSTPCDEITFS